MSKAKKLQKVKKPMSPRTKSVLVNSFKGIISNQACIDNGKEAPWWLAVLFLLFAIIIPLIPNHVQLSKAYGSSFIASSSYSMDERLAAVNYSMNEIGDKLVVKGGTLNYYDSADTECTTPILGTQTLYIKDLEFDKVIEEVPTKVTERVFAAYYTTATGDEYQAIKNNLRFKTNTTTLWDPESEDTYYISSYLILTPDSLEMSIYKLDSNSRYSASPVGLDWKSYNNGNILEYTKGKVNYSDYGSLDDLLIDKEAVSIIYSNWKDLIDNTYLNTKNKVKWNTTLIYLGVYAGLMFFLGLMLFLLTRGKNNPFRVLNFWVTQKIGYFLSWTPAVIAMIIGFIMPGNIISQMAFIMLVSLRVMWASMRQLRPIQ